MRGSFGLRTSDHGATTPTIPSVPYTAALPPPCSLLTTPVNLIAGAHGGAGITALFTNGNGWSGLFELWRHAYFALLNPNNFGSLST
ncbi:hypothetical protein V5799_010256 [Amblyomma americanum]|uniref:Uncharacterized protein n=1 Tax=Amblyomma americanum TaxID=6943 RepID=A0AAQ4F8G9_AMBAM